MAGACWVSCLGCYQPIALLQNNSESLFLCQFEHSPCPFCLRTLSLFMWKVVLDSSGTVKRVISAAVLFSFGKCIIWKHLQSKQRLFFPLFLLSNRHFLAHPSRVRAAQSG